MKLKRKNVREKCTIQSLSNVSNLATAKNTPLHHTHCGFDFPLPFLSVCLLPTPQVKYRVEKSQFLTVAFTSLSVSLSVTRS